MGVRLSLLIGFETETAHRLLGHPGLCKNLHGHSYKWTVELYGFTTDANGMLIDFSDAKRIIWSEVLSRYDHSIVLEQNDPLIEALEVLTDRIVIYETAPTAEMMAWEVKRKINNAFATEPHYSRVMVGSVTCQETTNNVAVCQAH